MSLCVKCQRGQVGPFILESCDAIAIYRFRERAKKDRVKTSSDSRAASPVILDLIFVKEFNRTNTQTRIGPC